MARALRRRLAAALAAAATLWAAGCGYGFSQRYRAQGGAERVFVRTFENRSTDPELGAALTASLREQLARRGASAGAGRAGGDRGRDRGARGRPVLGGRGDLQGGHRGPGRGSASAARRSAQHTVRRQGDYLGGADALETEGRRALALRSLADEAAREILRAFEAGAP